MGKLFLVLLVGSFAIPFVSHAADNLSGPVRVIDGDTLAIGATRVRIFGIDAPEADQSCTTLQGTKWKCGAWVSQEVKKRFGGRQATCEPMAVDHYGRTVARCHVKGEDIAATLVSDGLAFAYRQYSQDYVLAEKGAAVRDVGLHSSQIQTPSEFRGSKAAFHAISD